MVVTMATGRYFSVLPRGYLRVWGVVFMTRLTHSGWHQSKVSTVMWRPLFVNMIHVGILWLCQYYHTASKPHGCSTICISPSAYMMRRWLEGPLKCRLFSSQGAALGGKKQLSERVLNAFPTTICLLYLNLENTKRRATWRVVYSRIMVGKK